jgi:hypothetical protein
MTSTVEAATRPGTARGHWKLTLSRTGVFLVRVRAASSSRAPPGRVSRRGRRRSRRKNSRRGRHPWPGIVIEVRARIRLREGLPLGFEGIDLMLRSFLAPHACACRAPSQAREALRFYAGIAAFQHEVDREPSPRFPAQRWFGALGRTSRAAALETRSAAAALSRTRRPRGAFRPFCSRRERPPRPIRSCPRCRHHRGRMFRPQGDGAALTLVCSLCFHEWPASRSLQRMRRRGRVPTRPRASSSGTNLRELPVTPPPVSRNAIPEVGGSKRSLDVRVSGATRIFPTWWDLTNSSSASG